jgi:hypothetical protein
MVPITPLLVSISHTICVFVKPTLIGTLWGWVGDLYMRFDILGPRVTLKIKEICLEEKKKKPN